ncbi:uncharacterized protein LOC117113674 [Anneissia japonica]|uniref:uncharacterized protein LOC117113674 n=1 Tax=Anneissia japonica TaxID=1529436 RepID=UPI001425A873|nr:uncharacterized protein LOC117113674 [Anneissia japonica]
MKQAYIILFNFIHCLVVNQATIDPPPYQIDPLLLSNQANTLSAYPVSIDYLGTGYNLQYGNPHGSPITAGRDPGLRPTWKVFDWTFEEHGSTPDQVTFVPGSSCSSELSLELYHNAYAYASTLEKEVTFSVGARYKYGKTKFSHSNYYKETSASMGSNTNLYYEENTLCYLGEAQLMTVDAHFKKFPLEDTFVARVNRLPTLYSTNNTDYMLFIHDYGTHVLSFVFMGTREVKRYKWTSSAFVEYSAEHYSPSVSLGGSYKGFGGSISVDIDNVKVTMDTGFNTGFYVETISLGDDNLAMPFSYTLMGMEEIFQEQYWQLNDDYVKAGILSADFYGRLDEMKLNVEQALADYPVWLKSVDAIEDEYLTIPITWPVGAYGLPKTNTGCPQTPGFTFHEGWRFQDGENTRNAAYGSSPLHFPSGAASEDVTQHFCMKTQNEVTEYDMYWPKGQYCVFKPSTGACPFGMTSGWIYWDDEDSKNKNSLSSSVPSGVYDTNTKIDYCCRIDGFAENPIYLPVDSPFYLFPYSHNCQSVEGMNANMEFYRWDDEDTFNNDEVKGYHPYREIENNKNNKVYYCYYTPK